MSGEATCLVACLPLVNIYFDGAIWVTHRRFAATGSVFPAFGIVWCAFNYISLPNDVELTILTQPWLSQASRTHPLRRAAMLVTATPFGESSQCVTWLHNSRLNHTRRSFIISILAALSICLENYLFSKSASSLSRKLRSLSLRAILRQDSKSDSQFLDVISSQFHS